MGSRKELRIQKQLKYMKENNEQVEILQINGTDYGIFLIHGAIQSPYQGCGFRVKITWSFQYPLYSGIIVQILDPVWSLYVSNQGQVCLDILGQCWSPATTTFKLLISIASILGDRKLDGQQFLNPVAASQMKNNYLYFFDFAKNQAEKHCYVKKQIYSDNKRSKQQEFQILEKEDGKIESAIEKDLKDSKIRGKKKQLQFERAKKQ